MSDTPTAQPDVHLQVLLGQRLPPDPPAPLATARAVIAFAAQLRINELLDIPLRALHLHGGSSAWLHRFGMDWNLGDLLSARRGDLTIMRVATPPWQLVSAALAWITGVVRLRAAEAATLYADLAAYARRPLPAPRAEAVRALARTHAHLLATAELTPDSPRLSADLLRRDDEPEFRFLVGRTFCGGRLVNVAFGEEGERCEIRCDCETLEHSPAPCSTTWRLARTWSRSC